MKYLLLLFGLLFFVPTKSQAQFFDPDYCWTCRDSKQHFAAGAGLDIIIRGPYVTKSWNNKVYKRILWVAVLGAGYELAQYYEAKHFGHLGKPGFGFSQKDFVMNVAGAVVMEATIGVIRKIF